MRSLFRELNREKKFLLILSTWFLAGLTVPALGYALVPASIVYFLKRKHYDSIFFALLTLFILSDNRHIGYAFAATIKPLIMIMVSVFLFVERKANKTRLLHPVFRPFVPFVLIAFFCVALSPVPLQATFKTISYVLAIWTLPLIILICLKHQKKRFIRKLFVFLLVFLACSLVYYFANPELSRMKGRFRGWFGNPNGIGIFLSLIIPIVFIFGKRYRAYIPSKVFWRLLYVLLATCLLLCASRTAMGVVLLFFVFYVARVRLVTGILIIGSFVFLSSYLVELVISFVDVFGLQEYARLESLKEAGGRSVGLEYGLRELQSENYLLGRGFGYALFFYTAYFEELIALNHVGNAHNTYLTIAMNTGYIGLAFFLFAWGKQFFHIRGHRATWPFFFLAFLSAFFESWLAGSLNPFTILILLFLVVLRYDSPPEKVSPVGPSNQQQPKNEAPALTE